MSHPHADARASIADITSAAFPTPALAIRTNDPATLATIYGFAEHQAAAARAIAADVLDHLDTASTPDDITRTIGTALTAASTWRHQLAVDTREHRRGQGLALVADRFLVPITDGNPNFDRLGYVGRARIGSTWDAPSHTYQGGIATPAFHTLNLFGQYAEDRFAADSPRRDVLQNLVHFDDGAVVLGNRLLRRAAADRAAADLVARIAARGADASQVETGGDPIYTATATFRDRTQLRQAAITALAGALNAAAAGDLDGAIRQWALGGYCLYQSPQTKKGSDAVTRVVLVALGAIALRHVPRLPHDVDLRAYILGQNVFVEQLLARETAPATDDPGAEFVGGAQHSEVGAQ